MKDSQIQIVIFGTKVIVATATNWSFTVKVKILQKELKLICRYLELATSKQ